MKIPGFLFFSVFSIWLAAAPLPCFAHDDALDFLNRMLNAASSGSAGNIERLSSGQILLVDDPAGYAVYDALRTFVEELNGLIRNNNDMISYYRVEDGMLGGIVDALQRIRELAVERNNGILDVVDREIIAVEMRSGYEQITTILAQAEFNTIRIFADLIATAPIRQNFSDPKYLQLDNIDALLDFFIHRRSVVGAMMNRLSVTIAGDSASAVGGTSALSAGDVEYGSEVGAFNRNQILMWVNLLLLPHTGP